MARPAEKNPRKLYAPCTSICVRSAMLGHARRSTRRREETLPRLHAKFTRAHALRTPVRLPFDSLAVVARHDGSAMAAAMAEAVGEDLASALARSSRLRVPGAEFVRPYAASELSAEEIGRALNVRAVALCTISTMAAAVDAAVELIDVVREELVVRETFLVSGRELLALQRAMIRAIAPHCDGAAATAWPDGDEACYARIVQARAARREGRFEKALTLLGEAAPLETAAAIVEGRFRTRFAEAREILACGDGGVRALQWQAKLARLDGHWRAAEQALRDALELDAASPSTHALLGDVLLATRRREEAARHHGVAADLMPLDARAQIAAVYRDYFGPAPREAVSRFAALPEANDWLVRALLAGGDVVRARRDAATPFSRALVNAFTRDSVYAAPFTAHERALLFSAAGACDAALDCLEQCDDDALFFVAMEPLFVPLAREERFEALLLRLGL